MTLPSDDPAVVRRTQAVDLARAVPLGFLLALETSVLLTIAITEFDAPGWVKGVLAAAAGLGLLAGPMVTSAARHTGRPAMVVAAACTGVGAAGFVLAATGTLPALVVGSVVAVASLSAVVPLVTVAYDRNYPVTQRGQRVSLALTVRVAAAAAAGLAIGGFLRAWPDRWWVAVLAGAIALAAVAALLAQLPSGPLPRVDGVRNRPWPHFSLLAEDRRLALTLAAWMLMGFGNLMLLPLRVEYLANPAYGIGADAARITLLTVTLPSVVRLVTMPAFGRMFDRVSFFSARIAVNLCFTLYVLAFFTGSSDLSLVVGAVLFGVAAAGGDLMWSLWVTKFAPAGRVADYMGLHTFFTGVRAVLAPLLAFAVVARVSLTAVAWAAAALMVLSSAMLVPEARADRSARREPVAG